MFAKMYSFQLKKEKEFDFMISPPDWASTLRFLPNNSSYDIQWAPIHLQPLTWTVVDLNAQLQAKTRAVVFMRSYEKIGSKRDAPEHVPVETFTSDGGDEDCDQGELIIDSSKTTSPSRANNPFFTSTPTTREDRGRRASADTLLTTRNLTVQKSPEPHYANLKLRSKPVPVDPAPFSQTPGCLY